MLRSATNSRAVRWLLMAAVLALPLTAGVAGAAAPAGPRLAVVKLTRKPTRETLLTVDRNGRAPMRLAGGQEDSPFDGIVFAPLSWRPDGTAVAFTGLASFWLAKADGSGAHHINVADAEWPVFAPNGRTVAFTRHGPTEEGAIWTIDLVTGEQRRLTPLRFGLVYAASSFSPDGKTLLATRVDSRRRGWSEPVALDLATGRATRLLPHGAHPVYSPDGSEIALVRVIGKREITDLFVLDAATGGMRRLTRTQPGYELFASWDPSGERIAFARFRGRHFERSNSIHQINADGTCEQQILARKRTVFFGPAWQPGRGREAGRIEC